MTLYGFILTIVMPVLMLALVLVLIRMIKGPSLSDRVVALDLAASIVIAAIVAYAIATNQPVFVDVAIVMALLLFLGTVAFAYFLEKRR